jgi:hypothetical protein
LEPALQTILPNRDPCPVCGGKTCCPNHYFGLSNDLIMVEQTNRLEHWERVGPMLPFDKAKHIPKPVGNFYRIYIRGENQHG